MGPLLFVGSLSLAISGSPAQQSEPLRADIAALHERVANRLTEGDEDAAVLRRLALAYASGDGAEQDAVTACAYARLTWHAVMVRHGEGQPQAVAAQQLQEQFCEPLTYADRFAALQWMACPMSGLKRGTIVELEPGWWIVLNGRKVLIEHPSGSTEAELALFPCDGQIARIKHTALPASGAGANRHLLEVSVWRSAPTDRGVARELTWGLFEVRPSHLAILGSQSWSEPGSAWPAPPVPAAIGNGARFHVRTGGEIEYEIGPPNDLRKGNVK